MSLLLLQRLSGPCAALTETNSQLWTTHCEDGNMLVLSRKKDEKIVIGNDIQVMVIEVRRDKVRLGIEAPRDVSVHRREVYDAIRNENRTVEVSPPSDVPVDA